MHFQDRFSTPEGDQHTVDSAWFDGKTQLHIHKNDPSLLDGLTKEVGTLKAFHDGHMDANQAALAITRPISTSPVPELGGYSDEILAVCNLWRVIIAALVEWPSARTPNLFALLAAIAEVPDKLHNGEAVDEEGDQLTWKRFPYFALTWRESTAADLQPGQIYRQCSNAADLASAQRLYLRLKDIEAQLVSKQVLNLNRQMMQSISRALEKDLDHSDGQIAPDEASAYEQVKLDFHIPTIALMFRYNGSQIHERVIQDGLRISMERQMPNGARAFKDGAERWSFWKRRLADLAQGGADDQVKEAAKAALQYM